MSSYLLETPNYLKAASLLPAFDAQIQLELFSSLQTDLVEDLIQLILDYVGSLQQMHERFLEFLLCLQRHYNPKMWGYVTNFIPSVVPYELPRYHVRLDMRFTIFYTVFGEVWIESTFPGFPSMGPWTYSNETLWGNIYEEILIPSLCNSNFKALAWRWKL
jgi:hypothetical protein